MSIGGYHPGSTAPALTPAARLLAAADAYHAMTEPRPHRDALEPELAALLEQQARGRRLDADSVAAVLEDWDDERLGRPRVVTCSSANAANSPRRPSSRPS